MNIQDIEAFVAVAETGSVSRAANRLNLTQPATTRRIQNFEAAVGAGPLLNRTVKPATLTALGHHVLEHGRRVLKAMADLEACATGGDGLAGELRIGVAHGLGEMVLTPPLEVLQGSFPGVRLQISSNWSAALIDEVRNGAINCAIGLIADDVVMPAGLQAILLGIEDVVIISASRPPCKPDGSPWRLRDLAGEGWILNPAGCGCRTALTRAFDRQDLPMRIAAEIFGEDLQLSLLSANGGLSLVPRRLFEHSRHREGRQIVPVLDFKISAKAVLIRSVSPGRIDRVIDRLAEEVRSQMIHAPLPA